MTAFDDAMADLFADPNLSRTVLYRTGGAGSGVSVRVIWSEPQQERDFGSTGAVVKATRAEVRILDITEPAKGDTLTLLEGAGKGKVFQVAAPPTRDDDNLTATLSLKLVS